MYLTSNNPASVIADLEVALTKNYRALQATLKEVRQAGYVESRLNIKFEELKVLAQQVINFLQEVIFESEQKADKEADEKLQSRIVTHLPIAAQRYVFWKKDNKAPVVMVLQPKYYQGADYYLTFGSDALKLDRHTDRLRIYTAVDGVSIPCIGIPRFQIEKYKAELAAQGITLLLVN